MADACTGGLDVGFTALSLGQVAVLGVVQGISELLPISSTAHMRIVPALLGWPDPGSAFSAAMQLAALAAVVSYFWADTKAIAVGSWHAALTRDWSSVHLRLAMSLAIATVPIVIAGLLLSPVLNACGSSLRTLPVIGTACIVMAVLLILAELRASHTRPMKAATLRDAVIIGLAQAGALIPGISRSGSTLTAALFLGFERETAARYSFLLGLPAIFLAGVRELWALHAAHLGAEAWLILLTGLVVASIAAFAAIWALMRTLESFATWPFAAYRAVLGVFLLTFPFGN